MNRIYVGLKNGSREVFRSASKPTVESHGKQYGCVIGPFRTVLGARFMAVAGNDNPHCRNVADAERIARALCDFAPKVYRVNWDNGNDCGTLAGDFTNRRKAEQAGREWKRGMVDIEPTAKDRREARAAYSWEVVEVEPEPAIDPESTNDASELLRY